MKHVLKSIVCFISPAIIILMTILGIIWIALSLFLVSDLGLPAILSVFGIILAVIISQIFLLFLLKLPVKQTIKAFVEAFFSWGMIP